MMKKRKRLHVIKNKCHRLVLVPKVAATSESLRPNANNEFQSAFYLTS